MAILHVSDGDGTIQRFHVQMSARDVADFHGGASALEGYIAMKSFRAQRSGGRVQGDTGVGGNLDFVIHASRLRVGTG